MRVSVSIRFVHTGCDEDGAEFCRHLLNTMSRARRSGVLCASESDRQHQGLRLLDEVDRVRSAYGWRHSTHSVAIIARFLAVDCRSFSASISFVREASHDIDVSVPDAVFVSIAHAIRHVERIPKGDAFSTLMCFLSEQRCVLQSASCHALLVALKGASIPEGLILGVVFEWIHLRWVILNVATVVRLAALLTSAAAVERLWRICGQNGGTLMWSVEVRLALIDAAGTACSYDLASQIFFEKQGESGDGSASHQRLLESLGRAASRSGSIEAFDAVRAETERAANGVPLPAPSQRHWGWLERGLTVRAV